VPRAVALRKADAAQHPAPRWVDNRIPPFRNLVGTHK
jgi:hypothetical protein